MDAAVIEAGLDFSVSRSASLGLSYNGRFDSGVTDQGIRANFSMKSGSTDRANPERQIMILLSHEGTMRRPGGSWQSSPMHHHIYGTVGPVRFLMAYVPAVRRQTMFSLGKRVRALFRCSRLNSEGDILFSAMKCRLKLERLLNPT